MMIVISIEYALLYYSRCVVTRLCVTMCNNVTCSVSRIRPQHCEPPHLSGGGSGPQLNCEVTTINYVMNSAAV